MIRPESYGKNAKSSMKRMWQMQQELLSEPPGVKVRLFDGGRPCTFADVLSGWQRDEPFRAFFLAELRAVATAAFFWEMPPITRATLCRPYEFVVVNSPHLAMVRADSRPFAAQWWATNEPVVSFRNLRGDAVLVVPRPVGAAVDYAHLAAFLRNAPPAQQEALLQRVAEVVLAEVGERPLWLSTSGLGVYWLHIRLDSRPKYYTYAPYREGQ